MVRYGRTVLLTATFSVFTLSAVIWNKRRQHARRHSAVIRDVQKQLERHREQESEASPDVTLLYEMQFGRLDNAYQASREPIKGFNHHRINGVEKFNRDEHFLYLRQYDNAREAKIPGLQLGKLGWNKNVYRGNSEHIEKLHRTSSIIPPANNEHIKRRIKRLSIAATTGATIVFAIASCVGIYW